MDNKAEIVGVQLDVEAEGQGRAQRAEHADGVGAAVGVLEGQKHVMELVKGLGHIEALLLQPVLPDDAAAVGGGGRPHLHAHQLAVVGIDVLGVLRVLIQKPLEVRGMLVEIRRNVDAHVLLQEARRAGGVVFGRLAEEVGVVPGGDHQRQLFLIHVVVGHGAVIQPDAGGLLQGLDRCGLAVEAHVHAAQELGRGGAKNAHVLGVLKHGIGHFPVFDLRRRLLCGGDLLRRTGLRRRLRLRSGFGRGGFLRGGCLFLLGRLLRRGGLDRAAAGRQRQQHARCQQQRQYSVFHRSSSFDFSKIDTS